VQSDWQIAITNRYFVADKAYTGKDYNAAASIFENRTYTFEADITRFLAKGWSITLGIPLSANSRKNPNEHYGVGDYDYTTRSFGVNDIHIEVYKWILKPKDNQKFNFQLGLGLKLPTGSYNYTDYFHSSDSTTVLAPVNISIQLGDGGTGIITELNTFYNFSASFSLYGNFYYMFNPRDQNGVNPLGWKPVPPALVKVQANTTSVTDLYSIRAGASYMPKNWIFSAGVRVDGAPVNDALGQSHGLRRAGYNLSIEPGIMYNFKMVSVYYYMPILASVYEKTVNTDLALGSNATTGGSAPMQFIFGALFRL
jgi:hypothetical protein